MLNIQSGRNKVDELLLLHTPNHQTNQKYSTNSEYTNKINKKDIIVTKNNKCIRLLQLNIHSLRNKIDSLTVFLDSLDMPEILLLTEHWLELLEPCYIPQYYVVSKYCREDVHGYGGTMILVNKNFSDHLNLEPINKYDNLIIKHIFEFSISFAKKQNVYILCVYRPPGSNIVQFLTNLEIILMDLPANSKLILSGDLNINYENQKCHDTHALKNLLISFNLKMHVNAPTRITSSTSSLIDYFCTNYDHDKIECQLISVEFSDHEALVINCPFNKNLKVSLPQKQGRIFSQKNFKNFKTYASNINWGNVLHSLQPIENFHLLLNHCFNKSFPICKMRKRKKKKHWITKGIKMSAKNLRSLCYIKKFTDSFFFINYTKTYKKIYHKIIKTAKQNFYKNRIENAKNKTREAWSIVNDLRDINRSQPHRSHLNPNILNDYYCSIACKLTANLQSVTNPLYYLQNVFIRDEFSIQPTNITELKQTFKELKNKKSSGTDEITVKIFENLNDGILEVLSQAINRSFYSGLFPNCLKTALVIPLHKSGSYDDPANFRPISLLPTLSKIIEKILKKQILAFLNKHHIINASQFGFQKSLSTNDALFSFLENLYLSLNDKDFAAAIFCDLSKAFDCVNHQLLTQKLSIYGFRGISLSYLQSFITERFQYVKNGNLKSELKPIKHGVPQGSVLGPILFILYINDLSRVQIRGNLTIFADDATLKWSDKNQKHLELMVTEDISKIKEWCDSNYLCLNFDKTKVLGFKFPTQDIDLQDGTIKTRQDTKFLGLHIDDNLKFDKHIINLNKKLSAGCFAVRQTFNDLGSKMAKSTYYALLDSNLRYGIAFWGHCNTNLFRSVFVLQKRAVRYLCGSSIREHCKPLFVREKILTLTCIFILETVCLIFKKYRDVTYSHTHNTRNHNNISLPIPRYTYTKQSVIYDSLKMYNKLPKYCKTSNSYKIFRKAVKNLLIGKAYYDVQEFFSDVLYTDQTT